MEGNLAVIIVLFLFFRNKMIQNILQQLRKSIFKQNVAVELIMKEVSILLTHDANSEGNTVIQNVGKSLPKDTGSHP